MAKVDGLLVVRLERRDEAVRKTLEDIVAVVHERIAQADGVAASEVIATSPNGDAALIRVTAKSPKTLSRLAGGNIRHIYRELDRRTIVQLSRDHGRPFGDAAQTWESARATRKSAATHA